MKNKDYTCLSYSYILCTLFSLVYLNIQSIQFGQATNLSNYEPTISHNPQIAINNNGQAFAIWEEIKGGEVNKSIYARFYSNDFWGPASKLSGGFYAEYPQIAIDDQGNALAIWLKNVHQIAACRYSNEIWEDWQILSEDGWYSKPQLDMNGSGIGMAIWRQFVESLGIYNIYCSLYTVAWQASTNLNKTTTMDATTPQVVINDNGVAMAIWAENNSGIYNTFTRTYSTSNIWHPGVWLPAENLNYITTSTASNPQIAINNNNNAIAIWVEQNVGIDNIYTRRYSSGSWGSAENLNYMMTNTASMPQIAMDNNGNAIAVWVEDNAGVSNIYCRYFSSGSWGQAVNLNADTSRPATTPAIAMADNDSAIVVWAEGAYLKNIFSRQYSNDAWGIPLNLNNFTSRNSQNPQIAMNGHNQAIVISDELDRTYARAAEPIGINHILSVNSSGNILETWQKAQNIMGSAGIVQSSQPFTLAEITPEKTILNEGESSRIFLDANRNAWTFILSGSTLIQCQHNTGDPSGQWTTSIIATNVTDWSAAVNLLGSTLKSYIGDTGTLKIIREELTSTITDSACSVQAALSSSGNNYASLAFIGNCLTTRANNSRLGDVSTVLYSTELKSWVLSPTLASNAADPQIAVDNNFNVLVIWKYLYDDENNLYQIQASRGTITPAFTWDWSAPENLTPNTNDANASSPRLAVDGSGNAIALWEYTDNTVTQTVIQAKRYIFEQAWQSSSTTLSPTGSSASFATISMNDAGSAIVVWLIPYDTGTEIISRVQGRYFQVLNGTWQALTYFSPDNMSAGVPTTALGANAIGTVAYTLPEVTRVDSTLNNVYFNNVFLNTNLTTQPQKLFDNAGNYAGVSCAIDSPNRTAVCTNNIATTRAPGNPTYVALGHSNANSYKKVQWCSALYGTKQYVATVNAYSPVIDWYLFDISKPNILNFIQQLSFSNTCTINDLAVYNKNENNLYLCVATNNDVQIQQWDGQQFNTKGTLDTRATGTVNCVTWWVDTLNPLYDAYIATADQNNNVTIYGLDHSFTFGLIDYITVGEDPLTSLLWLVKTNFDGSIKSLDLIGGSTANNYEYTISVNTTTKTINSFKENTLPYPMGGLSTCNDYLAIGDYGAPEGIGASIRTYKVASDGTLTQTNSVIPDSNATHVYYLAKCCNGNPQYLLAGIGNGTTYTVYVYEPDLSRLITQQLIGEYVDSVAWSPTGYNTNLGITYQQGGVKAGRIYELRLSPAQLIDLGAIM
jgi:hypothetical protein